MIRHLCEICRNLFHRKRVEQELDVVVDVDVVTAREGRADHLTERLEGPDAEPEDVGR